MSAGEDFDRNIREPLLRMLAKQGKCTAAVKDEEQGWHECGKRSRFTVARSDEDESYGERDGSTEACAEHLADAVLAMVDGDESVQAVVTVIWVNPSGRPL